MPLLCVAFSALLPSCPGLTMCVPIVCLLYVGANQILGKIGRVVQKYPNGDLQVWCTTAT